MYVISSKRLDEMLGRGWILHHKETRESFSEFEERMKGYGWGKLKFYYTTTAIRGYYKMVAVTK